MSSSSKSLPGGRDVFASSIQVVARRRKLEEPFSTNLGTPASGAGNEVFGPRYALSIAPPRPSFEPLQISHYTHLAGTNKIDHRDEL